MADSTLRSMDGSPAMEDPDRLACRLMQRAHNRDGLPEIAVGLIFLYVSGVFAAQFQWPVLRAASVALILLIPLGYLVPRAIKWVRNRYLIERTGYVEGKPLSRKLRALIVAVSAVSGAISAAAVTIAVRNHAHLPSWWVVAGTGVFCGVLFPVCGRSRRFVLNGAVVTATGILLGLDHAGYTIGWTVLYGVAGAVTVITGTVVLLRFLRESPEAGD